MFSKIFGSVLRTGACCVGLALTAACDNAPGPPTFDRASDVELFAQAEASTAEQIAAEQAQLASGRILIDSVPRGAAVSYLPDGEDGAARVMLGETPLELEPAEYPTGSFVVMMEMDQYLEAIRSVPELESVAEEVSAKLAGPWLAAGVGGDLFQFDTAVAREVQDGSQRLVAIGPVYTLDYATSDRIIALFVPRGISVSDFFPLMPADGTYAINKNEYGRHLIAEYGFSVDQAREATGSLARCGKYVAVVEEFGPAGGPALVSLSAERGNFATSAYRLR